MLLLLVLLFVPIIAIANTITLSITISNMANITILVLLKYYVAITRDNSNNGSPFWTIYGLYPFRSRSSGIGVDFWTFSGPFSWFVLDLGQVQH